MFDPHADPHGERTVRSQGAKSAADLILLEKKGRKALEYKDWKAPNQLVRMRSPVQIRIAAPHEALEPQGFGAFCFFFQRFERRKKPDKNPDGGKKRSRTG